MKIKDGFILREVAGSYVAVAVGDRSHEFNGMVNLNATGAFLWEKVEKGSDRQILIQALLDAYDVSKEQAEIDVDKFISILKENGIIED